MMNYLQDNAKGKESNSGKTIRERMETDRYGLDVHKFYNDTKKATIGLLVQSPIGSEKYVEISNFFRFLIEVLFRESHRLGLVKPEEKEQQPSIGESNFETEATDGFYKIYTDAIEWYGEAYFILGQNGPLFSSMTGKAPVDPRETETHGQIETTKILPQISNNINNSTPVTTSDYPLSYLSPALTRIPHPALPPTELLSFFKHPIDAPLTTNKWLKFDGYSSFAPTKDNAGAILDPITAGSVWFEKLGQRKLVTEEDVQKAAEERIKEIEAKLEKDDKDVEMEDAAASEAVKENGTATDEDNKNNTEDTVEEKNKPVDSNNHNDNGSSSELKDEDEEEDEENRNNSSRKNTPASSSGGTQLENSEVEADEIDIESILDWTPASFIDDDEIQAAETGTEHDLLSTLILQLQHLQRVRLANNNGSSEYNITPKERRLALKIQNVLGRLATDQTPKSLDMAVSSHLPILQSNYQGVLPAPPEPKSAGRLSGGLNSRSTPSRARSSRR